MTGPEQPDELLPSTQALLVGCVCVVLFVVSWALATLGGLG